MADLVVHHHSLPICFSPWRDDSATSSRQTAANFSLYDPTKKCNAPVTPGWN
jgi:hypothetical protein